MTAFTLASFAARHEQFCIEQCHALRRVIAEIEKIHGPYSAGPQHAKLRSYQRQLSILRGRSQRAAQ